MMPQSFVIPCLLLLLSASVASQTNQERVPNGGQVTYPCQSKEAFLGLKQNSSLIKDAFEKDFMDAGLMWTSDLCKKDSDGDGRTNGQELGDSNCTWSMGQTPSVVENITHPGVCDPYDSLQCKSRNSFLTCESALLLNCQSTKTADVRRLEIYTTNFTSNGTSSYCLTYSLPNDTDYHISAIEPIVNSSNAVSRMLLLRKEDATTTTQSGEACALSTTEYGQSIFEWTAGMPGLCLEANIGYRFGKTSFHSVVLYVEYSSQQLTTDFKDPRGVRLYFEPAQASRQDITVFTIDQSHIEIPPGQSRFDILSVCTDSSTKMILGKSAYVLGGVNQMHSRGYSIKVELFRNNCSKVADLNSDESYNWESPLFHYNKPLIEMKPGDEIRTTCSYNSLGLDHYIYNGSSSEAERCRTYLFVYPRDAFNLSANCESSAVSASCDDTPGASLIQCDWQIYTNLSHPETVQIYNTLVKNCNLNGVCRPECQDYLKTLSNNTCYYGDGASYVKEILQKSKEGLEFLGRLHSCPMNCSQQCPALCSEPSTGCDRQIYMNLSHPETALIYNMLVKNCNLNGVCRPECRDYLKSLSNNSCYYGDGSSYFKEILQKSKEGLEFLGRLHSCPMNCSQQCPALCSEPSTGCDRHIYTNLSHPETALIYNMLVKNCNLNGVCRPECRDYLKSLSNNSCYYGDGAFYVKEILQNSKEGLEFLGRLHSCPMNCSQQCPTLCSEPSTGCNRQIYTNLSHPETAQIYNMLVKNCNLNGVCRPECQDYLKTLSNNSCYYGDGASYAKQILQQSKEGLEFLGRLHSCPLNQESLSCSQQCAALCSAPDHVGLENCAVIKGADIRAVDLRFHTNQLPPSTSSSYCMTFDLPVAADYYLVASGPVLNKTNAVRQLFLLWNEDGDPVYETPTPCISDIVEFGQTIFDWTPGKASQCFTQNIGYKFGKTSFKRLTLRVEYNNSQLATGLTDTSGVRLYFLPSQPDLRDIVIFITGQGKIEIPPGQSHAETTGTCPSSCTQMLLTKTAYIVKGVNQMHSRGTSMKVELIRNGNKVSDLTLDQTYNYKSPVFQSYNPPLELRPGDQITTTCVYNSVSTDYYLFNGSDAGSEMCRAYLSVYPKDAFSYRPSCESVGVLSSCDLSNGTPVAGCNWTTYINLTDPVTAQIANMLSKNCNLNGVCRPECRSYLKTLRDNPCFHGEGSYLVKRTLQDSAEGLRFLGRLHSCPADCSQQQCSSLCTTKPVQAATTSKPGNLAVNLSATSFPLLMILGCIVSYYYV